MHLISLRRALCILAVVPALFETSLAAVLAIDYGTDWMKASLMKPGVPFDVLLNKDSKRKIQSSVAWKRDDRLFGTDAANLASRFPSDSFSSLKLLQGVPFDSNSVSYFTQISTSDVVKNSRSSVSLRQDDGTEWSTEELIAMQLSYVKKLAEDVAGELVQDVVVTVPPYYTQFERDAVADAIEIAGLRTLALINDGSAVAINYAMTRTFSSTPEYHVIYDAGASSIRATVVSFASAADPKSKAQYTQISVLGVGSDRSTGGTELDRRLREILIEAFINKHKRDIRKDKRGMAKLWKEAGRIKSILSANTDATATVESLAFDIDFKAKITRAQFEKSCQDLNDRFAQPIYDALANAGLNLDNLASVILTGGSSRTPMIQSAVKVAVGEDRIAQNVNADESAVLGAALYGASLSRQFKTKDIRITDIFPHEVQASYFAAAPGSRTIHSLIFPRGSKYGTRKTLSFNKRKEDFSLWLDYKNEVAPGFPREILEAQISGVVEALGNLTERGAIDPVIKVIVALSESGFVSVEEAIAYGEVKSTIAGKLKSFFGGGAGETEGTADAEKESEQVIFSKDKKEKSESGTIPLELATVYSTLAPMSVPDKKAARDRLRALDNMEVSKQFREEAFNTLEGYLYKLRDLLDDGPETPFMKCSKPSEREAISRKVTDTSAWLHSDGESADTSTLLGKRRALESLEKPIMHRYKEIEEFPEALNNSQKWNWSTRLFLAEARANLTAETAAGLPSKWTAEELDALEKAVKEHEAWLGDGVEKQKHVKMNEDPTIETREMRSRAKTLELHLQRLVKRKAPKVKKTPKSAGTPENGESDETEGKQSTHDEL
ncbi:heat shock protein 70 family [Pisolithus croceorrhizus]|nr:heat shock protein 70 family [Pisolithus croceorrhizus]KAI6126288.1 heat shock protein 70 family [Pisolithus croceorrhizus]KAI6167599.1 heat shock protein 70 family [Pisolithus thermaeus]